VDTTGKGAFLGWEECGASAGWVTHGKTATA
jgi:hypothetical protein